MNQSPERKYIGYRQEDFTTPYAKYYNEEIALVSTQITEALKQSPFPKGKIPALSKVSNMMNDGYSEIENGYSLEADGSIRVAVLTTMPNVTPAMWDWWFSWHGSHANRYKLWHPKAHQSAVWKDGNDRLEYIGRTSMVEERIGKKMEKVFIRFVSPEELGFAADIVANKEKNVFICARIGLSALPVDFGWLVHQVRAVGSGSEMRSRFWMGGEYIQIRMDGAPKFMSNALQKIIRIQKQQATDLLIHCSEEMNHLAKILPALYTEFH